MTTYKVQIKENTYGAIKFEFKITAVNEEAAKDYAQKKINQFNKQDVLTVGRAYELDTYILRAPTL